jgi:hypothetical protein
MNKETKIKSIKIQIGKREIELTLDEAKELRNALGDLLGDEELVNIPIVAVAPVQAYYVEDFLGNTWMQPN